MDKDFNSDHEDDLIEQDDDEDEEDYDDDDEYMEDYNDEENDGENEIEDRDDDDDGEEEYDEMSQDSNDEAGSFSPLADEETNYEHTEVLSAADVFALMTEKMNEVRTVTRLNSAHSRRIMSKCGWDTQKAMEMVFSASACSLPTLPTADGQDNQNESASDECSICYADSVMAEPNSTGQEDDDPSRPGAPPACGHQFCRNCWQQHIETQIFNNDGAWISCPSFNCDEYLDDYFVISFIQEKTKLLNFFRKAITDSFVRSCNTLQYCPMPQCEYALKRFALERRDVTCRCANAFCFNCQQAPHEPCDCSQLQKWLVRAKDEAQSAAWLKQNSKLCPKCQTAIEKNGGCNHMQCRQCNTHFCWLCVRPYDANQYSHNCNDYQKKVDDEEDKSAAFERYLHYFARWDAHRKSLELEEEHRLNLENRMTYLCETLSISRFDLQFMKEASETLIDSRRTLMNSFVFAFFLKEGSPQRDIFISNQAEFDSSVEAIACLLELELLDPANMSFTPVERQAFNMELYKYMVVNKTRWCIARKRQMMTHIVDGRREGFWHFKNV